MSKILQFTSGSITIPSGHDMPQYTIFTYSNASIMVSNTTTIFTLWEGDKTDLDGNVWNITKTSNSATLTVRKNGNNVIPPQTVNLSTRSAMTITIQGNDLTATWLYYGVYTAATTMFIDSIGQYRTWEEEMARSPQLNTYNALSNGALLYYTGRDYPYLRGLGGGMIQISTFASSITDPSTDPYGPGGESGTGGGTGTFGGTGDIVGVPTLPTLSAVDTGFITLFKPSLSELNGLANYLWGSLFDISTWKKVFADPMDAILGLSIVPVNPSTSGSANIVVGNIQTSISMPKISSQYVEVDCGTLNIEEYWGAYLDYAPYTKFELYLPYIGTHPVSADDIMGDSIQVVYHVDVLSGACVAYVLCGGTIIYTYVGQCSSSIPITGNDWTNVINGTLSIAGSIGTMVATGGLTAPMAVGSIASTVTNSIKPEIEKSGAMSGTGGMLGVQTPYLIVTRPKQCVAKNQNKMIGYPSHIYKPLTDVVGYTEVLSIHLQGVAATDDELTEIVSLLQNGVIF